MPEVASPTPDPAAARKVAAPVQTTADGAIDLPSPDLVRAEGRTSPAALLRLQTSAGNQAAARLISRATIVQREPASAPPANSGLIVEDAVTDLRPEQMRRGEFVTAARTASLDGARTGAGPLAERAQGEVEATNAQYANQAAAPMEAKVRAEVAGAAGATSASALVSAIRQASSDEARSRLSEGITDSTAQAASAVVDTLSNAASSVASILFKGHDGGSPTAGAGQVGQARAALGQGRPVPDSLRAEVEYVTGDDLSDVRVHHSSTAQDIASNMEARAFTVGRDIVVGAGEAASGTPEGDALLAHELAHAAQQGTNANEPAEKSHGGDVDGAEVAADDVSLEAVVGLWGGVRDRMTSAAQTTKSRLKSGLQLQRCGRAKIDPTKEALNKKVLEGMATANADGDATKGVHYPFNYERYHKAEWDKLPDPARGYANPDYWTRVDYMHWVRKRGVSASKAMDAWFAGPTIAECATVATASEVNALRAALGDDKFDRLFGGSDRGPKVGPDGKQENLEIGQGAESSVVAGLMRQTPSLTNPGTPGKRNVSPGEWHYFLNHPAYVKRHPAGFWQGENALYQGEVAGTQKWTGFGATYSEGDMNATLVAEYNREPTAEDKAKRDRLYQKNGNDVANWPAEEKRFHGEFPAQITVEQLVAAGGGFDKSAGKELDPAKVAALKNRSDLD